MAASLLKFPNIQPANPKKKTSNKSATQISWQSRITTEAICTRQKFAIVFPGQFSSRRYSCYFWWINSQGHSKCRRFFTLWPIVQAWRKLSCPLARIQPPSSQLTACWNICEWGVCNRPAAQYRFGRKRWNENHRSGRRRSSSNRNKKLISNIGIVFL